MFLFITNISQTLEITFSFVVFFCKIWGELTIPIKRIQKPVTIHDNQILHKKLLKKNEMLWIYGDLLLLVDGNG